MCCWIRVQTQPAPWSSPPEVPEAPDPLSGDAIAEIFRRGREVQEERGGTTGAELVHSELPAEQWGVSQDQLADLAKELHSLVEMRSLTNRSKNDCRQRKVPFYEESKFWDVTIGPNMYQVNESHIQPLTRKKDPCHGIPCLSYALHCNSDGLSCDLFVSHAWSEGIFELSNTVVQNWPDGCIGAYICSLANPQNLPELMSHMIETPSQSPFFRVLISRPKRLLMIANSNVPIHSRLWCVYEAHCARTLGITTAVLGDPAHFATNRWASGAATRAVKAAVRARRRELAIADAMESAAADMDIMAAGMYLRRFERWGKRAERSTARATERMKRALDVRKATCSRPEDGEAIRMEIRNYSDEINSMICELIIKDQLQRAPAGPYKLTWYPGQDLIEGLCIFFQ
ncbi:unnamed protein product [Durusdinium trenchii]|uniref:Uncharacterized protein n=3 Tax=Durusdinium trenchii TaxID=1381693 RepID=A0ABP0QM08_9DINO